MSNFIAEMPLFQSIKDCDNILIAGAGGGCDLFSGLPLYFYLKDLGKKVALANFSFTNLLAIIEPTNVTDVC